jgi:thiamine-monophosphate kinase
VAAARSCGPRLSQVQMARFRNENELVKWLMAHAPAGPKGLSLGIGDDAALVKPRQGFELILTSDMTIEGVHFLRNLHPPRAVGHRALARSLSDVAAMGGVPRFALVSSAVARNARRRWIEDLYKGIFALAWKFQISVVGGDTSVVEGNTFLDVTVAGEVERGHALRRTGARPGDQIFMSGQPGLSAMGLRVLQGKLSRGEKDSARAIRAHLYPSPQCELGRYLARGRLVTSMMDLSDGLSTDLGRLCEASGVGAMLAVSRIPRGRLSNAKLALDMALHGGEDYQLLFTVGRRFSARIPKKFGSLDLTCIGEIEKLSGVRIADPEGRVKTLQLRGWDHFGK